MVLLYHNINQGVNYMKRFTALVLAVIMALAATGCSTAENADGGSPADQSQIVTSEKQQETTVDKALLQLLEDRVNTTQPGTAGTGLKAVKAAKDILTWAKENMPETEVLQKTVQQFFENSEYKDEAIAAFDSISYIFDALADGKAEDLLNSVGLSMEDFEISPEVKANIEKLIDEIERCRQEIEQNSK